MYVLEPTSIHDDGVGNPFSAASCVKTAADVPLRKVELKNMLDELLGVSSIIPVVMSRSCQAQLGANSKLVLTSLASSRAIFICLYFVTFVPGKSAQQVLVEGSPPGPFSTTIRFPWPGTSPNQECRGLAWTIIESASGNYSLEHVLSCPNQTVNCWVGVRRLGAEENSTHGPRSDNPLRDLVWRVPVDLLQPTNSCALRFSDDGDLQFFIPPPVDPETLLPHYHDPGIILWTSNTHDKGAVDIDLQDNGILVLADAQKAVVWQSADGPIFQLSRSRARRILSDSHAAILLTASLVFSYGTASL
ncbi:hypothetical protein AXG93_947s1010 [Marchantia polymorpha subsp. ruderalis]|uniref:Bulb-type lectin domain-containing protein n=1 Tax=Marchantia polymorpha subsp. ruderalis TaxID=1480154 RepID=A0A176WFJ9_MARPO|nr:hypothetical protein AXG93_947s1010 [Marchantia polymorpha subsp. ruderalis]